MSDPITQDDLDSLVRSWELYTGGQPGIRYEWNGSLTVNVFRHAADTLEWVGFNCFTFSEQPADSKEAEEAVIRHHHEAMTDAPDRRYTAHRGTATRQYLMNNYDPELGE